MLGLWLLACTGGSEHGNPEAPPPDGGRPGNRPGRDGGFGNDVTGGSCERELWLQPDGERTRYRCDGLAGGEFSEGPTAWRCTCGDDEVMRPWQPGDDVTEDGCQALLADACGVDLEQRNFCEHAGGACWPNPAGDDQWDCACGDAPEAGPLAVVQADTCEAAAFAHCASECEDPTGQCMPSAEPDRFDCGCGYFGMRSGTPAERCQLALAGCNPQLNDAREASGLACSDFAGFCDEVGNQLRCTCEDGTMHEQPLADLDETSAEACGGELLEACGNGFAQAEGFRCSLEKEGGRLCSASLRFADSRYDCHCESLNACNEEYDLRDAELDAATCEAALSACSAEDDAQAHPAVPMCTPDPGPSNCDGPGSDGRSCNAHLLRENRYRCECFLDDGLTEVDIRDQEIDGDSCEAALETCIDLDARP
jgi:hypothetical protein